MIQLYNYFRSSASYRVRIALELKGLSFDYIPVHLTRDGGEQFKPEYRKINPDALTPTFISDEGERLTQSLAIIEYLEEIKPEPALLPGTAIERAYIRSIALQISCEIHPLNNLRVLNYLTGTLSLDAQHKSTWYAHWVESGFASIEQKLNDDKRTGIFCFGDTPTVADICLVPQVFNAERMKVPLDHYPTIMRITTAARQLEAFARAEPSLQPDAF
jgi:maleylpyruvate isomerase